MSVEQLLYLVTILFGSTYCLPNNRIVGGEFRDINEFSYMVSLQQFGKHICGGSLIRSNIVLTAAHCTEGIPEDWLNVRVGSSWRNEGGIEISIKKTYIHPFYNETTFDYDLSLILLQKSAPINKKTISLIDLPNSKEPVPEGQMANLTGWGNIKFTTESYPYLQYLQLPIWNEQMCKEVYGSMKTEANFCAGGYTVGGKGACRTDSGGPLSINNKVYGVVSYTQYECGHPGNPELYVNVANLRPWINKIIKTIEIEERTKKKEIF